MELLNRDPEVLKKYSRDASLFEITPKAVAKPSSVHELKELVAYATEHGESLTMRAGGSDMTGGPLSESIVVDVTGLNKITSLGDRHVTVEPGVFYRDLEKETLKKNLLLPCYPASKHLAALGGMINNNCAGEKSLRYGKMENFIISAKWIFADGNEYTVKPLTREQLAKKMSEHSFEGKVYREIHELIAHHYKEIMSAKPQVSKNSSGYYLWNVIQGETFDLNRLLVGSQGTLGILTEATLRLEPVHTHHDLIVLFFKSWDELPEVVNAILPFNPEGLETFDKETLKLALHYFPQIAERAGENVFSLAKKFLPEAFLSLQMMAFPELVVLVEMVEENEHELKNKVRAVEQAMKKFKVHHRVIEKDSEEEKFWTVRRESFSLLREHSNNKRTVPLVEDFCIPPEAVPSFLPRAKKILEEAGIKVNIAGHAGNGNFHIIPLMDLRDAHERAKLIPVAEKFYDLVVQYKGTLSGEHNDGLVRTPFLNKMFSPEILDLFRKTKEIFDPKGIFNPNKKVMSQEGDKMALFKRFLAES